MPRTLQTKLEIEFYHLSLPEKDKQKLLTTIQVISQILKKISASKKINLISLPVSPLIHQSAFIEYLVKDVFDSGLIPYVPLSGLDDSIINNMKEIGLEKHLSKIEQLTKNKLNFQKTGTQRLTTLVNSSIRTKKLVQVTLGPNNIHDILDSLKIDH